MEVIQYLEPRNSGRANMRPEHIGSAAYGQPTNISASNGITPSLNSNFSHPEADVVFPSIESPGVPRQHERCASGVGNHAIVIDSPTSEKQMRREKLPFAQGLERQRSLPHKRIQRKSTSGGPRAMQKLVGMPANQKYGAYYSQPATRKPAENENTKGRIVYLPIEEDGANFRSSHPANSARSQNVFQSGKNFRQLDSSAIFSEGATAVTYVEHMLPDSDQVQNGYITKATSGSMARPRQATASYSSLGLSGTYASHADSQLYMIDRQSSRSDVSQRDKTTSSQGERAFRNQASIQGPDVQGWSGTSIRSFERLPRRVLPLEQPVVTRRLIPTNETDARDEPGGRVPNFVSSQPQPGPRSYVNSNQRDTNESTAYGYFPRRSASPGVIYGGTIQAPYRRRYERY